MSSMLQKRIFKEGDCLCYLDEESAEIIKLGEAIPDKKEFKIVYCAYLTKDTLEVNENKNTITEEDLHEYGYFSSSRQFKIVTTAIRISKSVIDWIKRTLYKFVNPE